MKNIKWLSLAVLLLAVIYFLSYNWNVWRTKDDSGPVIEMEAEQISVSVSDGDEALLQGVTATDAKDGDVTSSLVIESISHFTDNKERYVNYAAFDSDNHVSKMSRKLVYTDYTPIRFTIEAPLRFQTSTSGVRDILGNIYAQDCLDGDLSDKIRFSPESDVDVYSSGDYKVTLEVTNSAGDIGRLPATVTIYEAAAENAAPKIALSEYLVYVKKGETLEPKHYLQSVTWHSVEYALTEGRGTFDVDTSDMDTETLAAFRQEQVENPAVSYDRFEITNPVDYQTPGVYEIKYSLEDEDENRGTVNLIVVVEEA